MDATASVVVHDELSRLDPGLALSYLPHEIIFVHNLEDMVAAASNLLGTEGGAHVRMTRNIEIERIIVATQSIGIALRCCDIMTRYAVDERKALAE